MKEEIPSIVLLIFTQHQGVIVSLNEHHFCVFRCFFIFYIIPLNDSKHLSLRYVVLFYLNRRGLKFYCSCDRNLWQCDFSLCVM